MGLLVAAFAVAPIYGATVIISDTYNVTTSGTGFGLNAGVNTGINPPATRLTGTTAANLRYLQTVTTRPAASYDINNNRVRITADNSIGRFTFSSNGSTPFDFGSALGTAYATADNPISYDVKISMRNDATGNPRFSLGLATVEGDINNMDFAVQMYRANTGDNFYTLQKRIDRGSYNGTTTTDGTGDLNAVMTTTGVGTNNVLVDFLIRVTDAGSESGANYHSRIQVSLNNGSTWIYDTDTDAALPNGFRFDGTGRYFAFDQAPNTTGTVYYDAFSVTWNSGPRTWNGAGANGNWSNATNWGGATPVNGSALIFSGTTRQTNTNDLSNLSVPWLKLSTNGFALWGNAFTVTSAITNTTGSSSINAALTLGGSMRMQSEAGTLTIAGAVAGGTNNLTVDGLGNTTVSSAISGSGNVTKNGSGTLQLSGSTANTYSGNTLLNAGTLTLAKTAGVNAVAGNITVGDGSGTDILRLGAANQISDSSVLTIAGGATFDLNSFSETVAAISSASSGSQITLGSGTLTTGDAGTNSFAGVISGTGGFVQEGTGSIVLTGANTYSGTTLINSGTLQLGTNGSIASSSIVTIGDGATLDVLDANFTVGTGKTLAHNTVNGVGFVSGSVTFNSGAQISLQADALAKTAGFISIDGDVTFNGNAFTINVINGPLKAGTYPLMDHSGFRTGSFSAVPAFTGSGVTAGLLYEVREGYDGGIELHVYPPARIWLGVGTDNNWTTTANWTNNAIPTGEDPIVFNGTSRQNSTNNLSGLSIESLTFKNGGFTINGNALENRLGVTNLGGNNTLKGNLSWNSAASKTWSIAAGSELVLDNTNTVDVIGDHSLIGGGTLRLKRTMSIGQSGVDTAAFVVSEGKHILDGGSFVSSDGYYIGSSLTTATAQTILTNGASLLLTSPDSMLTIGDSASSITSRLDINNSTINLSGGILAIPFSESVTGVVNQTGGSVSNVLVSFNDAGAGDGSYSINNGTLTAIKIIESFPGTSSIYFDNATVRIASNADPAFMIGLDLAQIQSGGLTLDARADVTVDQPLSGTGALTKIGTNKVILGGANSYGGNTTISSGTLTIGSNGTISNSPTIQLANGATLDISAGGFAVGSSQTLARHTTSGAGNIIGTLVLNTDATISLAGTGSGNTVGSLAVAGGLTLNGNIITINVSGAALGASTNTIITYSGSKSGSFNLFPVIIGSGLAAGMTADIQETAGAIKLRVYAGPRIWRGGGANDNWSTAANWLGAIPNSGDTAVFAGTSRLNNTNDLSSLSLSSLIFSNGDFTLNGNTLTLTNAVTNVAGINTIKHELAWASTAVKSWHIAAGSELKLPNLNTIEVAGDHTFYGGGVTRLTGTMNIGQATTATPALVINKGTLIVDGGTLNSRGGYRVGANASLLTDQTVSILTNGANVTLTVSAANIRVGNSINGGTGRLEINNSTLTLTGGSISIPYTAGSTGIMTQVGGVVSNCVINFSDTGAGTGSYTIKDGTLDALQIREDTAAGTSSIYFDNATLRTASGAVSSPYFAGLNTAQILSGGLTFKVTTDVTVGQVLSGSGFMVKTGAAKLTLTGANTYSGNTFINTGTLAIGTGGSIASSLLTISSGATLDASVGGFTLGSGKTLAGGSTSGTANITGNFTASSGAQISSKMSGSGGTVGVLAIAGNLTANGNTITVDISGAPLSAGTYTLISYTGTKTGSFNATPVITGLGLNPGLTADIQEVAGQINLRVLLLSRIWDGGGANDNWSAIANWDSIVPVNGDNVIFAGTTRQSNTNDLIGLSLASVTLSNGGFVLNGNPLSLTAAITNLLGTSTFKQDINWSSSAPKFWNIAGGGEVSLDDTNTIEVNGDHNLIGGGTLRMKKRMNIGQATTNNPSFVITEGNQIIDGGTFATKGDLRIGSSATSTSAKASLTNNATLSLTGPTAVLRVGDTTNAVTSILEINNSSVTLSNATVALPYSAGASGQISQNGGTVSGGMINFNQIGAGTGIYNITGGTLETLQIKKSVAGGQSEIHFDNATLRPSTGFSNTFFTGLDVAEIQSGGLTFDATANVTISQALSGTGSLTKVNSNKLTLAGANTYSGDTLINAGTLALGAGGSMANSPNIVLPSGSTFDVSAVSFSLAAGQTISCTSTSGTATVTGSMTMNSGARVSLQLNGSNGAVGILNVAGNLTVNGNTIIINVNNASLTAGTNTLITYTGTKTGSFNLVPIITGSSLASGLTAEILETAGAIKLRVYADSRIWTGGGANNYWSTAANWTGSAPTSGDNLVFNGTTRQNNTNNISGLGITFLNFNNGGFTLNGNSFSADIAITNFSGVNTIKAGLSWAGTAGKTWNLANGSELVLNNTTTIAVAGDHTMVGGGTLRQKGTLNVTANPLFIVNEGKHIIDAGTFSSIGGYRIGSLATGTGAQMILTNGANFTITANGGGLRVGDAANPVASRLDIDNSTLTLSGGAWLALPYAAGAIGVVNQTGGTVTPGTVSFSDGGAGTGSYTIKNGTLVVKQIRENNAAGTSSIFFDNATLRTDSGALTTFMTGLNTAQIQSGGLTLDVTSDVTIGQALSGTGDLTKIGANKVTLTAVNSYSGATKVNAGNLTVATGGSIASSSDYSVASGATLDVSGITFTVAANETLSCSSSSGTANVTGNVTLASGSLFGSEASGSSDTVGKVAITGNLTVNNNTITVNVTGGTLAAGTYPVLNYTGTKTGSFNIVPNVTGSGLAAGLAAKITETTGTVSLKVFNPAETNTIFKVMSYNIHSARGPDGVINTDRIANYILAQDVDICGLNEVARNSPRSNGRDLIAELAQKTGYSFVFSNNNTALSGDDEFGNAILSRYPILFKDHKLLPKVGSNEQRGWLKAVVEVGNGKFISFQTTHLDFHADDTERLKSVTNINKWVAEETLPTMIVGDFNDTPETSFYNLMQQKWVDIWLAAGDGSLGRTVPCPGFPDNLNARIDYIWRAKGWNLTPTNAYVGYSIEGSDHYPVLTQVILKDGTNHESGFSFPFNAGTGTNVVDSVAGLKGTMDSGAPSWNTNSPTGQAGDYSLWFNGSKKLVVPDPKQVLGTNGLNDDYTLQTWVKVAVNYAPAERAILFQYERKPGFSFSINTNRTLHTTAFKKQDISSNATLPNDGQWHHIAVVHTDGVNMKFYIDGVLSGTVAYTAGAGYRTDSRIVMGADFDDNNQFTGFVDRVKFDNRALSPSEFDYPASPLPRGVNGPSAFETWKASFGISDSEGDEDGDGQNNFAEFIAGTNPKNPESVLRMVNAGFEEGNFALTWKSVGGKRYRIQYTDDLNRPFSDLPRTATEETDSHSNGVEGTQTFTDTDASSHQTRYYRVKVVSP